MSKKVLISLAPLFATIAFAVLPAAAQASPHWFKSNVELAAAEELPLVGWGTLTLTAHEIGTIECQNVAGGDVQNTALAPSGVGIAEIEQFVPYDCTGICPEVWKVTPEGLPWDGELTEVASESNKKRARLGITKPIIIHVECPGLIINEKFKGELTPSTNNGTSATKPSFIEFDHPVGKPGSGHLTGPVLGEGAAGGKAKVEGYNEQEVLTVK